MAPLTLTCRATSPTTPGTLKLNQPSGFLRLNVRVRLEADCPGVPGLASAQRSRHRQSVITSNLIAASICEAAQRRG